MKNLVSILAVFLGLTLLTVCVAPDTAQAATALWPVTSGQVALVGVQVTAKPLGIYTNGQGGYNTLDLLYFQTDTNGLATMTNLSTGDFTLSVSGPYKVTPITIRITNYFSTNYVATMTIVPTNQPPIVAFSTTASDARYLQSNNIIAGNNVTITTNGLNLTIDASGGGGGSSTNYQSLFFGQGVVTNGLTADIFKGKLFGAATTATNFNGSLSGDVSGTQSATVLATVATPGTSQSVTYNAKGLVTSGGALTAAMIPQLTGTNVPTGNVNGATNFTGPLVGDVIGTQSATVVSKVAGVTPSVLPLANSVVKRDISGSIASNILYGVSLFPTNTYFSSDASKCPGGVTFTISATINSYIFTASQPVITRANGWVAGYQFSPTDNAQYWVFAILNNTQFLARDISMSPAHATYMSEVCYMSPNALFCSDNTTGNEGMAIGGDGCISIGGNGGNSAALLFNNGANTWVLGAYNGILAAGHLGGAYPLSLATNAINGALGIGTNIVMNAPITTSSSRQIFYASSDTGNGIILTRPNWQAGNDVGYYGGDTSHFLKFFYSTAGQWKDYNGMSLADNTGTIATFGAGSDNLSVGIGNTSPSYRLDITGTFRTTGSNTFTGTVDNQSTVTNRAATLTVGQATLNAGLTNTATDVGNAGTTHLNGNVFVTATQTNTTGDFGNAGTTHLNGIAFLTGTTNLITGRTVHVGSWTNLTAPVFTINDIANQNIIYQFGTDPTVAFGGGPLTLSSSGGGSGIEFNNGAFGSYVNLNGIFTGNGAALTGLNASQLTSGSVPAARISSVMANALTYTNAGVITSANSNQIINANGAPKVFYTLATNMQIAGLTNGPGGVRVSFQCFGATNHSVTVPSLWKQYGATNLVSSLVSTNSVIIVTNTQGLLLFIDSLDGTANPAATNTTVTMGESNN